ncbi:hypothetical protein L1765_00350 [Microaerobacter geothermalis]|uniref:hypothetical protein n=1 Tax=Microaerobacter geothermalis TaxID=674972 RepID=UPI001F476A11|nr:hypothetical protein [Microaerobacter geothermalis]MCF6092441.1 hypothetical protein [Microaerobacter geothermalis]
MNLVKEHSLRQELFEESPHLIKTMTELDISYSYWSMDRKKKDIRLGGQYESTLYLNREKPILR